MSTYERLFSFSPSGYDRGVFKHDGNYPSSGTPTYTSITGDSLSSSGTLYIPSELRSAVVSASAELRITDRLQSRVSGSYSYNFNAYYETTDNSGNKDTQTPSVSSSSSNRTLNWDVTRAIKNGSYSVYTRGFLQGQRRISPVVTGYNTGAVLGDMDHDVYQVYVRVTLEHKDPIVTNLTSIGEFWERPITVNWRSEFQEGYEYELFYNNVSIKTGSGGGEASFVIPPNTFTGTLPATVRVRTYNDRPDGERVYSNWAEKSISLKDVTATITNLLVNGDKWEKVINITWQSIEQQEFKIEVFENNAVIQIYTGTTATSYNIPAETLGAGDYVFKVSVAYAGRFTNSQSKSVRLTDIVPAVSAVNLSGSNVDLDLSLTWSSTDQQIYEVEILKDSSVIQVLNGTTGRVITFSHNTLTTGNYTFRVRVAYKDRWSSWQSISTTLVETFPSIGVFEPDSVIKKASDAIRIWWTSTNQSSWELKIDGDVFTYNGTYETEKILEPNQLGDGRHRLTLTVTYTTPLGVNKPVSKSVEFIVQGQPPIPTFTSPTVFTTSMPVISWDTQSQQGFILEIYSDDGILRWTTGWQNGLVTRQKILAHLRDGNYSARLKIINMFSIESDWSLQDFTVTTSIAIPITLNVIHEDKFARLQWDNPSLTFDYFYVVRDEQYIFKTENLQYDDYSACNEHEYIIVGMTTSGVARGSNAIKITLNVRGAVMATVDDLTDMMNVGEIVGNWNLKGDIRISSEIIECTGREYPVTVYGEHTSEIYSLEFTDYTDYLRFLRMCKRRKVFCYRDRTQKLYLSVTTPSYILDNTTADYTVVGTRTSYSEVIDLD